MKDFRLCDNEVDGFRLVGLSALHPSISEDHQRFPTSGAQDSFQNSKIETS